MSKKKTPEININLVPKDPFFESPVGRFMNWAIKVGRYIVIFTELVVIVSFASRFTLDRRVTDLNDALHQKEMIINSFGDLESNFKLVKAKIDNYEEVSTQNNLADVFPKITEVIPHNVVVSDLSISRTFIKLLAEAKTDTALNVFISNLQISPYFFNVDVGKIETAGRGKTGYVVSIDAQTHLDLIGQEADKVKK